MPNWTLRVVVIGAVLVLVGAATPQGAIIADDVQFFLSFYAGVFTLLAMTTAVVSGLLATDRMIMGIRQRVMAQSVHRAASLLAMTMVVSHVLVKVLGGLAVPAQIVVPGVGPVGLGAAALDLMLVTVLTGVVRARFAFGGRPWVWRSMHAVAYVFWPMAIGHGLTAGRPAAPWVILSYVLCLAAVVLALMTRMFVSVRPRNVQRAGEPVPAPAAARTRMGAADRAAEREAGRSLAAERAAAMRATEVDLRGDARVDARLDPRVDARLDPRGDARGGTDARGTEVLR